MKNDGISLNKYLSSQGLCSRREADKFIEQGRVTINGIVAKKGNRVLPGDQVIFDSEKVKKKKKPVYIMFHKPSGITCTTDRKDKTNIIDALNFNQRIFPIGRLDKDSTGLILLTNDGDAVNPILRKENKHEKEYMVSVAQPVTQEFLDKMSRPMSMLGKRTRPAKVTKINNRMVKVILTQGLNRQIRRMCQYSGNKVTALKRTRIMHIRIGKLREGEWRYLSEEELQGLQRHINS